MRGLRADLADDPELGDDVVLVGDRDPRRLDGLLSQRGAKHELAFLDERDPNPRVVAVEHGNHIAKHLVRVTAAVEDSFDRLECAAGGAHVASASPSKARTASL